MCSSSEAAVEPPSIAAEAHIAQDQPPLQHTPASRQPGAALRNGSSRTMVDHRSSSSPSVLSQLTDSGTLKFLGGLALGLLARSISVLLLEGGQPPAKSSSKSKARPRSAAAGPPLGRPREELKMVLCVNQSLGMGKGKIGAQCAHAAVGVLGSYKGGGTDALVRMWERCGQPKIALKVQDEQAMAQLASQALQMGLPAYIVHDAGRTQIAAGSQTVLAIGPGYKSDIDRVTGRLSLL